jgi:AraC-like DNA-binding protein
MMKKKMDLDNFNLYKYFQQKFPSTSGANFILADRQMLDDSYLQFPFRSSFYGIGMAYATGNYFQIGSNDYQIERGTLVAIGPGIVSQWNGGTHAPTDSIMFTEDHLKPFFKSSSLSTLPFFLHGGNHILKVSEENIEKVEMIFQAIKAFINEPEIVSGLTYSLVNLVIKIHEQESIKSKSAFSAKQKTVRAFKSLVAQHFLKNKDVSFYAKKLHITPKYLSEILLSETGKTAKAIIDDTLFLEAKSLLRQTDMNVQQICYYLGYSDTSYFTRAFKKKVGLTPMAYREL